ncbi:MAG: hypothetical protein QXU32_02350 [Nitrososphaerales archaeon]
MDDNVEDPKIKIQRAEMIQDFLNSIKDPDDIIRPIYNPEAFILRNKAEHAARTGKIKRPDCSHPLQYLKQYVDEDPSVHRRNVPVNLFECGVCHSLLWFVDAWGRPASDGYNT